MNPHFFQHRSNNLLEQLRGEPRYLIWWSGRIRYSHPWSLESRKHVFNVDWFSKLHGSYHRRLKRMTGVPENKRAIQARLEFIFQDTAYARLVYTAMK